MKNGRNSGAIGFWAVVAIGIGGMVGGGIFAVLGLAAQMAHGSTPIAFLFAGIVALLTSYSYARLSVTYPSQGGTVEFINQAFGTGVFTGAMNILLWISYIIMLSLYAFAFGSYGASFFPASVHPLVKHLFISGVIVLLTGLNAMGSSVVGEAEEWIVGFKIAILIFFIGAGLWTVNSQQISPGSWVPFPQMLAGGMIIFLAYEGFELIANTANDVQNPGKLLPRAYYTSIIFVIVLYILVSLVTVGNLSIPKIVAAKDYALAESARPFLGNYGFIFIAIAALLSTGSAINATLYGTARISYIIAKDGELPDILERKVWKRPIEGLLITAGFSLAVANFFDLSSISLMGSAGFLLIFAVVNASNVKLHQKTGSHFWISGIGFIACLAALAILIRQTFMQSPGKICILVIMIVLSFVMEYIYKKSTGRIIQSVLLHDLKHPEQKKSSHFL